MKVWNYVFISVALLLVLQFAGIENGASPVFDLVGVDFSTNNEIANVTTSTSPFGNQTFGSSGILVLLGVGVATVIVGFFTKARLENMILLPIITGSLWLFVQTFMGIIMVSINNGVGWIAALVSVIFVPFTVGFILALAEFFRGTD